MKKGNSNFILVITILMYIVVIILSILGFNSIALVTLIICAFSEMIGIKKHIGYYNSIVVLFTIFSIVYGLSGPITAMWGKEFVSVFVHDFNYGSWFISYSLSEIALIISLLLFIKKKEFCDVCDEVFVDENKIKYLAKISYILMFLGSSFQLINMLRIGGFSALFMDKALYQALETDLTMTLPATQFVNIAIACFSLYLGFCRLRKARIKKSILYMNIIFLVPYLVQILLLGQRGNLLSMVIVFFLGYYYYKPIFHLKGKIIGIACLLYLLSVFLYTNRGITSLIGNNNDLFFERVSDISRYVDNINPGSNEFSAPFGNYNTFVINGEGDLKYGESYLRGILLSIPSFFYPGVKPVQITYEFRNTFFASLREKSSISGTAFSSILEAYWNFGFIGVFLMYFIYGLVLSLIENGLRQKTEFYKVLYILVSVSIIPFSRMQLGGVMSVALYYMVYALIIVVLPYQLKKNSYRRKEIKNYV